MCHVASSVLLQGEERIIHHAWDGWGKIAERIDANLLNVPIQQLIDLPVDDV